jgi:hypothetical protein
MANPEKRDFNFFEVLDRPSTRTSVELITQLKMAWEKRVGCNLILRSPKNCTEQKTVKVSGEDGVIYCFPAWDMVGGISRICSSRGRDLAEAEGYEIADMLDNHYRKAVNKIFDRL